MRPFAVLAVLAVTALLMAACGGNDDDDDTGLPSPGSGQEPTPVNADDNAPIPSLSVVLPEGGTVEAEVGTHCWGNVCVDMAGPITGREPIELPAGAQVELSLDSERQPTTIAVGWAAATEHLPAGDDADTVAWLVSITSEQRFDRLGAVTVPNEPGEFVLIVTAFWQGDGEPSGDVSYGLYVRVID